MRRTIRTEPLPSFLLIGAAKAGTGAIYEYCRQHPQIFMSPVKEPHFFSLMGQTPGFRGPGDDRLNRTAVTDLREYHRLFESSLQFKAAGEASVSYLYSENAAENIANIIPLAKLVVVLRNPVDRAYSSFLYRRASGLEPCEDFEEALADEPRRIEENWQHLWHYRSMSEYAPQLERYLKKFPREQLLVHLYEDLVDDRDNLLRETFRFVGADPEFLPQDYGRPNVSGVPRSHLLQRLLLRPSQLRGQLGAMLPNKLRRQLSYFVRRRILEKPRLDDAVRRRIGVLFEQDIDELEGLLGRRLNGWRARREEG